MTKSASELARASLQAYVDKDRATAEALIAEDFHFTSPLDNALDRETYFRICWPNSERMTACKVVQTVDLGDQAYITYEAQATDRTFRNTELHTARDGKLVAVELYFGWNIPHKVAPGGHIDNPPLGGHP
jgi:ketosteroid isomerase-like protein